MESIRTPDSVYQKRSKEKLKIARDAHLLKIYQTLFADESSSASREEKKIAEKKLRERVFQSLAETQDDVQVVQSTPTNAIESPSSPPPILSSPDTEHVPSSAPGANTDIRVPVAFGGPSIPVQRSGPETQSASKRSSQRHTGSQGSVPRF